MLDPIPKAIELFRKNFDLKKNSIQKNNYNAERSTTKN